jgi:precorrin-6A/cobalt-precorrin-6A reductase
VTTAGRPDPRPVTAPTAGTRGGAVVSTLARVRPTRVLLLAGTTEATELAARLAGRPDVTVTVSLAGRTRTPAPMPDGVRTRTGGFGGVDGLARELDDGGYDAVVDATHPFAAVMPHHAAAAAARAGLPRVRLIRPPWRPADGDDWREVADLASAAETLATLGATRVLLTTGRLELAPFATVAGVEFVVRSIEPPDPMPLPAATVVLDRGPYTLDDEVELLRSNGIGAVVTKNSGGEATGAKLVAARSVGVPVVMVRRPASPDGPQVATPADAVAWLDGLRRRRRARAGADRAG